MACAASTRYEAYVEQKLAHFAHRISAVNSSKSKRRSCRAVRGWDLNVTLRAATDGIAVLASYSGQALAEAHRHKAEGVVQLIERAAYQHKLMLLAELFRLPNRRSSFYVSINDFQSDEQGAHLPLLERCTTASATAGVPIPDSTFASNHEARSSGGEGHWASVLSSLLRVAASKNTTRRLPRLTWRGEVRNQPTFLSELPLEHRRRRGYALREVLQQRARLAQAGIAVDVQGTSPLSASHVRWNARETGHALQGHLSWPQQCASRYLLHLDGFSYSASLKYKLACGAVVLRVSGGNLLHRGAQQFEPPVEWFEAVHPLANATVPLLANLSGWVDELLRVNADEARREALSTAAANYARRHLSPDAVTCYMATVLRAYMRLYGKWEAVCGPG